MALDPSSGAVSPRRRSGLLRDQVQLVKRKDSDRYEIIPIQDQLSFEKGFFIVIRACQLLAQKNDGIILVGVAGPSGAGKTVFTEKVLNFMPSIAVITMDNYNDSSRIIDGNFDGKVEFLLFFPPVIFVRWSDQQLLVGKVDGYPKGISLGTIFGNFLWEKKKVINFFDDFLYLFPIKTVSKFSSNDL